MICVISRVAVVLGYCVTTYCTLQQLIDYLKASHHKLAVLCQHFFPYDVAMSRDIANRGYDVDFWFKRKMLDLLNPR